MKFEFEGRIDYFRKEGGSIRVIGTSTKGLCIDEETYNSMSYENLEKIAYIRLCLVASIL